MLEELKTFIAVVEHKNFTAAAKEVNLSQPSVSIHIKNLEAYFNTELINRSSTRKSIFITDSGKLLYRRSQELLALLENTKDELLSVSTSLKGHLRIGASFTIGECLLPQFLGAFCKSYPDIEVEVLIDNTAKVATMLKEHKLDIAFIEGNIHSSHFIHKYFLDTTLVLITPKDLQLPSPLNDLSLLKNQRWLLRESGSDLRERMDFFLSHYHIVPRTKLIFNSTLALLEATKNNLGITLVPSYLLMSHTEALKDLNIIPVEESVNLTFSYILLKDLRTSHVVQLLLRDFSNYLAHHIPKA